MTLQENKPEVSWSFQHFFRLMRKVKKSDEKRWSDDIKRACIKVLITSCQEDVKSWLLIFCFYNRGAGGGRLTRSISEVIRSCPDSYTSFVSPRNQSVYHWRKIRYQLVSVQMFYRISISKSGNSRFHARRVFHCLCTFVVHKSIGLGKRQNR